MQDPKEKLVEHLSKTSALTQWQNAQTSLHRKFWHSQDTTARRFAKGLSRINSLLVKKRGGKPRLLAQDIITSCISPAPWVWQPNGPRVNAHECAKNTKTPQVSLRFFVISMFVPPFRWSENRITSRCGLIRILSAD